MTEIKVFVADVDHTMRGMGAERPGKLTISALEEMHRRGYILGIASGRPLWQSVEGHAEEWGLSFPFDFVIGTNGGELRDRRTGIKHTYYPLEPETIREIAEGMKPLNIPPFLYRDGYVLTERIDENVMASSRRHNNRTEAVKEFCDLWAEPTGKLLYRVNTPEEAAELGEFGKKLCNEKVTCFFTNPTLLEFQSPLINKGVAVQKYCEMYGYRPEEVIAFGDAQNDLEMLKMAGISVCPSNAMEDVKAQVDTVSEYDCGHDAVGHYLWEVLLK